MLKGFVFALIAIAVGWAIARWRKRDPVTREGKVPPALEWLGWVIGIFFLIALGFSLVLAVKSA